MISIAVVAICKNESKFVRRWLNYIWNNGHGADKVYLLDTGSTDNTIDEIQKVIKDINPPEGWITLGQVEYECFRFDTARNDCLSMVEEESDLYLSIDLDEVVIPDFWNDARALIEEHPKFSKLHYNYCWKHDSNGNPILTYFHDRGFSSKDSRWNGVTHEYIVSANNHYEELYLNSSKIYVHHYPDDMKDRRFDDNLILSRCILYGDDPRSWFYLCRQIDGVEELLDLQNKAAQNGIEAAKKCGDSEILVFLYCYLANNYRVCKEYDKATEAYEKAIEVNKGRFYKPYIDYAYFNAYGLNPKKALELVSYIELNKDNFNSNIFCEDISYSTWRIEHVKAVSNSWLGKQKESKEIFDSCIEKYFKHDDVEKYYATNNGFFKDYEFVCNQINQE